MKALTLNDYLLIGVLVIYLLRKLLAISGWERGAMIADELQEALQEARDFIAKARAGDTLQIDRAAEAAAAKIKGVNAAEMRPVVEALVNRASDNRYGVNFALDTDGNVSVDPSGLAAKLSHKAGKWLKKVF
jgi:hypothetical protein